MFLPLEVFNTYTGDLEPMLATGHKLLGAKGVQFTLRKGVKWSDGKPLTGADVAFSIKLLQKTPSLDSNGVGLAVASVKVKGSTITFKYKKPNAVLYSFLKLSGEVEVDETYIGGKARNMHKRDRRRKISGTGMIDKTAVLGIIERGGPVRVEVIPNAESATVQSRIRKTVEPGSAVYTDALRSYSGLSDDYAHEIVDHAEEYVNGRVHTNGMENFWSLLKRGLHGTYISVEAFHLFRYLDERAFTFNLRELNDTGRFDAVLARVAGRRLTYAELIGQT